MYGCKQTNVMMIKLNDKHENLNLSSKTSAAWSWRVERQKRIFQFSFRFSFISFNLLYPSSIHYHLYEHLLISMASVTFPCEKMEMCLQIKLYEIQKLSFETFLLSANRLMASVFEKSEQETFSPFHFCTDEKSS